MNKYLPSFLGYKIQPEVKNLQKSWKQLDANKFKIILQLCAKYLHDNNSLNQQEFDNATKGMDKNVSRKLFAGTLLILRSALRSKYESNVISDQLQQEIQMPAELASLVGAIVKTV